MAGLVVMNDSSMVIDGKDGADGDVDSRPDIVKRQC